LNPVRAGMHHDPDDWPWSSHRAYLGHQLAPPFLADDELLAMFAVDPRAARAAYSHYVSEGRGQRQPPWERALQAPRARVAR
jgi:putative transposase